MSNMSRYIIIIISDESVQEIITFRTNQIISRPDKIFASNGNRQNMSNNGRSLNSAMTNFECRNPYIREETNA